MKTLNLVNESSSNLNYVISKFPDGQKNITITGFKSPDFMNAPHPMEEVEILSRMNNFLDLELIICAVKALSYLGITNIGLKVPYFLGSRSDRQFEKGSTNYLKDVICPIINSLKLNYIEVLDPHSDVLEACLNRFVKSSNKELVKSSLNDICDNDWKRVNDEVIILSPDAGASKKIYKLAEEIGFTGLIITCSKDRGKKGELTKTIVPSIQLKNKTLVIIDDICDGGKTFTNIIDVVESNSHPEDFKKSEKYLIVTHGIFSKGVEELSERFTSIYCTDSYKDFNGGEWTDNKQFFKINQYKLF